MNGSLPPVPEGGCTCGAVRYRLLAAPMFVHCCHCRWCQRETGSAFALNAMIETDRVQLLQGNPVEVPVPSESGSGQRVMRCTQCQVALWSHYPGGGPAIAFVRVGTLDAPHGIAPDVHIYTASKQPWLVLDGQAPVFDGFYDPGQLWPAESRQRYHAAQAQRA